MKRIQIILCLVAVLTVGQGFSQSVVIDPGHIATSIINTTNEIVETATTAENMIRTFQEAEKIYQQGKEYYDKLRKVNNLVKDARKVQQTILLVGEISDIYVVNFQKMLSDPNFTVEELGAIAKGYTIFLEECKHLLKELQEVRKDNGYTMNDKERMDMIQAIYTEMLYFRNLTRYYTHKTIGVSYLRSKKRNDTSRILSLYGKPNERYW